MNGYANIEIPNINEIQKVLLSLGQKNITMLNNNKNLSLSDIAMAFAFYVDADLEIIKFRNRRDLEENLQDLSECINLYKSPLLISINSSVYTILGINHTEGSEAKVLLLNHNYSANNSFLNLVKSGICKWVKFSEFILENEVIEILIFKISPVF